MPPVGRPAGIVTAASSGIGAAIVARLRATHDLVVMSRSPQIHELASDGVVALTGSVTDPASLDELAATARERFGRLDVVAMSAGHPPKADLFELDASRWQEAYDLLLASVIETLRRTTPLMIESGGGAVALITSYAARTPELSMPTSSVFRAALASWVKLYAERYASDGIRANAVLPGYIATHEPKAEIVDRIPAGRYGEPDEIASVVEFLVSQAAGFVSGQCLLVDGAMVKAI